MYSCEVKSYKKCVRIDYLKFVTRKNPWFVPTAYDPRALFHLCDHCTTPTT